MNCKNCQSVLAGDYCHVCGQKIIERFSFRSIVRWIAEDVFVFDKGFAFTLKELLVRPVTLVDNYISGTTKKYFNPYKLLLILTTVPFIIISFGPSYKSLPGNLELLKKWPDTFTLASFNYFFAESGTFLLINSLAYYLTTIPFWTLFSFLFFKRRDLNYIEHLIFISYISSGSIIAITLMMLFVSPFVYFTLSNSIFITIGLSAALLLFLFIYTLKSAKGFYHENYFKIVLKGILTFYLGGIMSFLFQFLLLSVWKLFI